MAGEVWGNHPATAAEFRRTMDVEYWWSDISRLQAVLHVPYSTIPSKANGDATKKGGKDKFFEPGIDDFSRPSRYHHEHEPSKVQRISLSSSDNSYLEHKEKEGEQQEEVDAGSRFLGRLRAKASIGALRTSSDRSDIVERQPKSRTLRKKRKRGKREKLNRQHFSLGELVGNSPPGLMCVGVILLVPRGDERLTRDDWPSPTSDPPGDVPSVSRSTGTPVQTSPSPPSIKTHPSSPSVFPHRSDPLISRLPGVDFSTMTAPPCSCHRLSCDTLASTQTYETPPSYRSRRSTQTFTDPDKRPLPTTPRTKTRPLPLPPLPAVTQFVP
ncbi:hypothetical protein PM082_009283 [Marasmius tenuissimus]|nr:hypothetical protein PM082_009283 [Marasmius tenuissimus]